MAQEGETLAPQDWKKSTTPGGSLVFTREETDPSNGIITSWTKNPKREMTSRRDSHPNNGPVRITSEQKFPFPSHVYRIFSDANENGLSLAMGINNQIEIASHLEHEPLPAEFHGKYSETGDLTMISISTSSNKEGVTTLDQQFTDMYKKRTMAINIAEIAQLYTILGERAFVPQLASGASAQMDFARLQDDVTDIVQTLDEPTHMLITQAVDATILSQLSQLPDTHQLTDAQTTDVLAWLRLKALRNIPRNYTSPVLDSTAHDVVNWIRKSYIFTLTDYQTYLEQSGGSIVEIHFDKENPDTIAYSVLDDFGEELIPQTSQPFAAPISVGERAYLLQHTADASLSVQATTLVRTKNPDKPFARQRSSIVIPQKIDPEIATDIKVDSNHGWEKALQEIPFHYTVAPLT